MAKKLARYIESACKAQGITQRDLQKVLNRSQGYVSERISGKLAWNITELDMISPMLGFADSFALMAAAHES